MSQHCRKVCHSCIPFKRESLPLKACTSDFCADTCGGAVAQSVERPTPGEEVLGSTPAMAARSLLVGSVSV